MVSSDPRSPPPVGSALALSTHGLRRTFGDFVAVDGIDLAVPEGSFYGFLGPNGAGKSTTIKCLTGLLRPSAGSVRILGLDPERETVAVKRKVGVVPEDLALFDRLTGAENLAFVARVHGLDRATFERRAAELLELLELADAAAVLAADYSHGMRKKLSLAMALLASPRLLFLDEPFEGIDAVSSRLVKRFLLEFTGRGGTVFLTSHVLEIVERLADHVGIIHRGRLVAQGPIAELRTRGAAGDRSDDPTAARSLEDLFLGIVGATASDEPALEWLGA
jgi:ABC-2 type transport system ATP-binding protein